MREPWSRRWPRKRTGEEGKRGSVDQLAKESFGSKVESPCSGQVRATSAARLARQVVSCQRESQARGASPENEARAERPSKAPSRAGVGMLVAVSKEGRRKAGEGKRRRRDGERGRGKEKTVGEHGEGAREFHAWDVDSTL